MSCVMRNRNRNYGRVLCTGVTSAEYSRVGEAGLLQVTHIETHTYSGTLAIHIVHFRICK